MTLGALLAITALYAAQSSTVPAPVNTTLASVEFNKDPRVAMDNATNHTETIVLGAGCFWGAEKRYAAIPGVIDAVSGYADGQGFAPTYQNITQARHRHNPNNYAEVVEVSFNPNQVSLADILKVYYETHDPTQLNRQGNDIGTQYRSTILYGSEKQKQIATSITSEFQSLLIQAGYGQITTKIAPLDQFHPAEAYHQDYLVKNPNGYCPDHSTGVTFQPVPKAQNAIDNTSLASGKHILIIDSESHCPYCEKFKKDVANAYRGTIPMSFRYANQLEGLTIKTPTWATPTLIFLENGKEQFAHQGYVEPKAFYQMLGSFKLGDSEAYQVAFSKGTDARFCKQYEIFKNTPDGVFIDKLSGAPLFDTQYRFDSGSGWLSFTQPVDGQVYEIPDHSLGMVRTEIRSTSTDIHLGHVFNDGPGGKPRYCINATVLEFIPREDYSETQTMKATTSI